MEADKVTATETRVPLAAAPAAAAVAQDRVFWIGLACASVLHAALLVEASRSASVRQMGEKGGQPDGISVELIDAADLKAKNSFAEAGAPKDAEAPQRKALDESKDGETERKKPAQQRQAEPTEQKPAEPTETKTAALAPLREKPANPNIEMELKAPSSPWAVAPEALEKLPPPAQGAKPAEPAPKPAQKEARLKLDFSMPDTPMIPGPGGAAMMRPAGITRSGENDEFGRGVIRALRKTLPRPRDMRGRVTVRFLISPNGDLVEVQLLRSAGIPLLDREVVFSVKQASFPFPPRNAPPVDRTFLVTYIYH
jgi:TonB family protein